DTVSPAVTLNAIASPTKDTTPTLEGQVGTAKGDDQAVTVTVYEGTSVGGGVASSGSATVGGGSWTYTTKQLTEGTYTAQATQGDQAGNVGLSSPATFRIRTTAPEISLSALASPTNDPTPTLKGIRGTASGDKPAVTVAVYEGSSVRGAPVASSTFG